MIKDFPCTNCGHLEVYHSKAGCWTCEAEVKMEYESFNVGCHYIPNNLRYLESLV